MDEKSLLDIILDPDNTDPVTLYGEDGVVYSFDR